MLHTLMYIINFQLNPTLHYNAIFKVNPIHPFHPSIGIKKIKLSNEQLLPKKSKKFRLKISAKNNVEKPRHEPRTASLAREASDRKSRNLVSRARDHFDRREARPSAVATPARHPIMRFWAPCQHLSPPSLWGTTFDPLETLTWFDLVNSWPESFRGRRREKCSIVLPLPLPLPPRIYNTRTTVLGFICDRLL